MREPAEWTRANPDAHDAGPDSRAPALHEARTEAVVVLTIGVALFAGLAGLDAAKGWSIIDLPSCGEHAGRERLIPVSLTAPATPRQGRTAAR